jgi:hypothetical protein
MIPPVSDSVPAAGAQHAASVVERSISTGSSVALAAPGCDSEGAPLNRCSPTSPPAMIARLRAFLPLAPACATALLLTLASCAETPTTPTVGRIDDVIVRVASPNQGVEATLRGGELPLAQVGGVPTVSVFGAFINGGSARVRIARVGAPFSRAVLRIAGRSGYYSIGLPEPRETVDLTISVGDSLPAGGIRVEAAVGPTVAQLSKYGTGTGRIITVGTGDVQVSVFWDEQNDLDLNVTDPTGETVSFANETARSGGVLDLDSNAGCSLDNVNNENIVWPTGRAPRGEYVVRASLWSNCSVVPAGTNYTVTVRVVGQPPRTFSGRISTVTPSAGGGTEITRFTY